uniref:Secreted protein n=1 Tax=Knipowitschia caucasica TaxID=637954 RepID=A0AAV2M4Q8_KNICA
MSLGLGAVVACLVTGSLLGLEPVGARGSNASAFAVSFGYSTIESMSCSWDKSGIYIGSPPSPAGRECVPFTGS